MTLRIRDVSDVESGSTLIPMLRRKATIAEDAGRASALEHDPEKWTPVFRKDHAQTKR